MAGQIELIFSVDPCVKGNGDTQRLWIEALRRILSPVAPRADEEAVLVKACKYDIPIQGQP